MKPETTHLIHEGLTKIAENPKVGLGAAGFAGTAASEVAQPLIGITANEFAVYIGIAVAAVSLYNQIMVAIRSHRDNKLKSKD